MSGPIIPPNKIPSAKSTRGVNSQKVAKETRVQNRMVRQVAAKQAMLEWAESGYNSLQIRKKFNPLEENVKKIIKPGKKEDAAEEQIAAITQADESAARFTKKNPELQKQELLSLLASLTEEDTAEDILQKVLEQYSDYSLADDALLFLLDATRGEMKTKVQKARDILNENFGREIAAGKNISTHARASAEAGLGKTSFLRDVYRDISGNPQEPIALFDNLSRSFNFNQLKEVLRFIFHSIGSDLVSKGPSIQKGELYKLLSDVKILQAIYGVYRFFLSRTSLISSLFAKNDLYLPAVLNFENLSKTFMQLLKERFFSSDKILLMTKQLGVSDEVIAQIIVLMQIRDAIRQVSPRLYKSEKQKQELLYSLIETLEELEEDEEEDEEDNDEK